jgi:cobalamin biosynthetic protein CobC
MRDHGGDLDRAKARFGHGDWLDLSTGINRRPYPCPDIPSAAWRSLPTHDDIAGLESAAAQAYGTRAEVVALAGAQAAIQLLPRLFPADRVAILMPSYNEYAAAFAAQGWRVEAAADLEAMAGAHVAVVVNPNNPDGRRWWPEALAKLAAQVGWLVVDESFADAEERLSLAPSLDAFGERVVVLRSFGKFYGLGGLRLGFALSGPETAARLRTLAGPWAVSGPAISVGRAALSDTTWRARTAERLVEEARQLASLLRDRAGWETVGKTSLFVTVETGDALGAQTRLARGRIWTRAFPYSAGWLRVGLPGEASEWTRLEAALAPQSATNTAAETDSAGRSR